MMGLKTKLNPKLSQGEMMTKLKIFHEKFGVDIPADDASLETVKNYYDKALSSIEDISSKNYDILQESIRGLVDDEDEPEQICYCTYFWGWFCNLYIRICISQVED